MAQVRLPEIDESGNFTNPDVMARLREQLGGDGGGASDTLVAGFITDAESETNTAVAGAAVAATGATSEDPLHTTKVVPLPGRSGVFIRNEQNTYALKVDQYATNGAHDAVNIAANFAGAHTPLGIVSGNTDFSTVKVTNTAAQVGGMVFAAVGSNPARTAGLFGGDNFGQGPSFVSAMKAGGDGVAFRAAYDPGTYTKGILWATGHHTAGNLLMVENDTAHTSGSMLKLVESNSASSVPIISIDNAGTGWSIAAPNFRVLKDGRTAVAQLEGLGSFSHGTVQMKSTGVFIERSANDANPTLKIQDTSGSGTGDITQFVKRGGAVTSRVSNSGAFATKAAQPADAELGNGEMAIWYDVAGGAFKVKAKDATGVVKVGTVTLA